ncbi:MAG TPA: hypothetical protein VGD98_00980 [Ktedonobacteraceae bacterium]
MFPLSSIDQRPTIAPGLIAAARALEERSPGLHVLAARPFRYPVQQQKVTIRVDVSRKLNLFEKYMLRAALEISPPPSLEDVADAFGLDPIFIKSTLDGLVSLQNITYTGGSLRVTAEGKKSLTDEHVPDDPLYETWYFMQDMVLGTSLFSPEPLEELDSGLEDLSTYLQRDLTQFPVFEFHLSELQTRLKSMGLKLHNPEEGSTVTALRATGAPEVCWKAVDLFVFYDTLNEGTEQTITFQAGLGESRIPAIGTWLAEHLQAQNLSLKALCGLDDNLLARQEEEEEETPSELGPEERKVEERLAEIRQQATHQLRLQVAGQDVEQDAGTAVQLRDVEIRPAFLSALQEAREQIIIYSPWINDQVVDDDFLSLLESQVQRGVRILIGYGIGRDEKREGRPISSTLPARLQTIQTAQGTPGIIAEWLGNSHAKEIVIDRHMHFSGSHNWLSYRGDRFPRGETVYKVTIASEVEKAYSHLAQRFIERARSLWSRPTDEKRRTALCILGYLGHEPEAASWIQRDECYPFIPLWLTLAAQAIATGHIAHLLDALHILLRLSCTEIGQRDALRAEIATALEKVLQAMGAKDRELASSFISHTRAELELLVSVPANEGQPDFNWSRFLQG